MNFKTKYKYSTIKNSLHHEEPWVNVLFLKYITFPLVFLMVNFTRITPNIISFISFVFGLTSAFLYFNGEILIAGLSYFVSYIFDATDGKVARIKKIGKIYGAWVDTFIDRCNLVLISTAISYHFFMTYNDIIFVILNTIFLGIAFIGWESRYNIDIYKLRHKIYGDDNLNLSKYEKWCKKRGLVKEPISLPELFLFYLIILPHFNYELSLYSIVLVIFFSY